LDLGEEFRDGAQGVGLERYALRRGILSR